MEKIREIWLGNFCIFLENYPIEFNINSDLAINIKLETFLLPKVFSIPKRLQKNLRLLEKSKTPKNN